MASCCIHSENQKRQTLSILKVNYQLKMEISYQPYVDPQYESIMERIHPPRVCIDNKTCQGCTLVKVDRANRHGILLEMVQVLTDLDLVISKSYISSDGGWLMDVFHVTDQLGRKITDDNLIRNIQQALCASRSSTLVTREVMSHNVSMECTSLEMTMQDRPGIMSEIVAALEQQGFTITSAVVWTHNTRAACVLCVEEVLGGPITDPNRLVQVQNRLETMVGANQVRFTERTHTERRLHQLLYADGDYENARGCDGGCRQWNGCGKTHVSIETCKEKGYLVVNVRCRDRPKLLFDTVCVLTDMQYVVFHAAVSSQGSIANQEYFVRQKDGCTTDTEDERRKLRQFLIAAIERRASRGLRLVVRIQNRESLLSDLTRKFRENGWNICRADIGTQGGEVVGSFHVTDVTGNAVNPKTVELVRQEIGGSILVVNQSPCCISRASSDEVKEKPRLSFGDLVRAQLERLSSNFSFIRS